MDMVHGTLKEFLSDPRRCLLPVEEWPHNLLKANVWVENDEEWQKNLPRRGAKKKAFTASSQKRMSFAYLALRSSTVGSESPKQGKPVPGSEKSVLRSIPPPPVPTPTKRRLNMTARFLQLSHGTREAQVPSHWPSSPFVHSCRRETSSPQQWVSWHMGWQSACATLHHTHRNLCFPPPPLGAWLDPNREVRSDAPLPSRIDPERGMIFHERRTLMLSAKESYATSQAWQAYGNLLNAVAHSVGRMGEGGGRGVPWQTSKELVR